MCRTGHRAGQRRGGRGCERARRLSRGAEEDAPVVSARVGLRPASARRSGDCRLDRLDEGNAAQLDRPFGRNRSPVQRQGQQSTLHHLHHPCRHHVWRHLYGACSRERICGPGDHPRAAGRGRGVSRLCEEAHRTGAYVRPQGHWRVYRFVCHQPIDRRRSAHLGFGVCAGGLWHRRHHGSSRPRLSRLRLCQALLAAHHPADRGCRRERAELRRQGGHRVQLARRWQADRVLAQRTHRQGGHRRHQALCDRKGSGPRQGQLPSARRHLLSPALLGRTLPRVL